MPLRSFSRVACRRALGVLTASAAVCSMWPSLALAKSDAESPADLEQLPLTEGLIRGARFLDENRERWEVDASAFDASLIDPTASVPAAVLTKLQHEFVIVHSPRYGKNARPMRSLWYIPGVSVETLLRYSCDIATRLSWDTNYMDFSEIPTSNVSASALPPEGSSIPLRPPGHAIGGETPASFEIQQRNVMTHSVGSAFFRSLGLKPFRFLYLRLIAKAQPTGLPPCYSILFRSIPQEKVRNSLSSHHNSTQGFMHYQETVLLPVFGATDLKDNYQRARRSGSFFDAANAIRLKEPEGSEKPAGVLLIVTSVNDVSHVQLPRIAETFFMKLTSSITCHRLFRALQKEPAKGS